jgi:predicted N-acetyltransferase YhbS
MNVEASWRGTGLGMKLLEHFFADLRNVGVAGVHLYCGPDPLEFYLGRGFRELGRIEFRGAPVYTLGQLLTLQAYVVYGRSHVARSNIISFHFLD